ncbi:MAG: metallophosphoesterase [Acidobacteria bacterium]|nr:metallophosphoesterase [Acidobacteriota bacterium]
MASVTNSKRRWTRGKLISALVLIVAVALVIDAFFIEPNRLVAHQATITMSPCLEELRGLRITAISDIHAGSPHITLDKIRRLVTLTNDQQPDLILLPGDFVIQNVIGGSFIEPVTLAAELKNLKARIGVFAALGNHDWWYNASRVKMAFEEVGIKVLDNQTIKLEQNGKAFWLAGFADKWEGNPTVIETLKQIADTSPIIAFTHNPDLFPEIPNRVALTIAGHTHGGQVALPLVGRLVVPSKFKQRYAAGHIIEGGKYLFVTTGVGTSIIPVRFRVPPEIAVLTIN